MQGAYSFKLNSIFSFYSIPLINIPRTMIARGKVDGRVCYEGVWWKPVDCWLLGCVPLRWTLVYINFLPVVNILLAVRAPDMAEWLAGLVEVSGAHSMMVNCQACVALRWTLVFLFIYPAAQCGRWKRRGKICDKVCWGGLLSEKSNLKMKESDVGIKSACNCLAADEKR